MKEDQIKKIVQNSQLETSYDFTHRLMEQIEIEKSTAAIWSFKQILLFTIGLIIGLSFILFQFLNFSIHLPIDHLKRPLFLILSTLFLFGINYLIRLNEAYKGLQKKTPS
jgi:hypothetical protein